MTDPSVSANDEGPLDLVGVFVRLDTAYHALIDIRGRFDGTIKDDTAFAVGEAAGVVARARELVRRDMRERGFG
jgi:hypothetical protein